MARHLGFDPSLQMGIGVVEEENLQIAAFLLNRMLQQPYELRYRDKLQGKRVRTLSPRARGRAVAPDQPLVRIMRARGGNALLFVCDPRYEAWEVPVGSRFLLLAGEDAYFRTDEQEYLVHLEGAARISAPPHHFDWEGESAEIMLTPPGEKPSRF